MTLGPLVTPEAIRKYVSDREAQEGTTFNCAKRQYAAAVGILRAAFGQKWITRKLAPDGTRRSDFLKHDETAGNVDAFKHPNRVVALAELLVNFQTVDGFGTCVEEIRTESIETGLAKLAGAKLLYVSGIPFRFVPPSRRLGADFDVEAVVGAATVACEMKAKLESTSPAGRSVVDTLRTARKQLPDSSPNIVFLRIPEAWMKAKSGQEALAAGIREAFRNSRALCMVVAHWEEWMPLEPEGAAQALRFFQWTNDQALVQLAALQTAIAKWPTTLDVPWLDFAEILCSPDEARLSHTLGTAVAIDRFVQGKGAAPSGFVGKLFRGEAARLHSVTAEHGQTIIDLECDNLEIFETWGHGDVNVTLEDAPQIRFDVFRATPTSYQFQVPGFVADPDIEAQAKGNPPARHVAVQQQLDSGVALEDLDEGDEVIDWLSNVFRRLRDERLLQAQRHVLRNVEVRYMDRRSGVELCRVTYLGRAIAV